jgi:hydrogenase maturation protease
VFWEVAARSGPEVVVVPGGEVRKGSRVRLRPRPGGDIFDLALAGRVAVVEGIDEELEGKVHLAVTLEEDPGRDLGEARQPGHRFFFSLDEVEVLAPSEGAGERPPPRVLVAGIGNIFLGDDGFGVEVVRQLLERPREVGVDVVDFGIRGVDLAYALQGGYAAAILVDAAPRGYPPGTLSVIEPDLEGEAVLEPHGMDPVRVLRLAREMGGEIPPVRIVACEPDQVQAEEGVEALGGGLGELSAAVRAAVEPALALVAELIADFRNGAWVAEPVPASGEGGE